MATVAGTTDAELLRRLRTRDRDAWEELYVEYHPRLRGFAYRLAGNDADADDLVQETFVRAVPRLDRLDPETANVGAYLFTTMRNLFLKQVERAQRQQPVAEVPEPAAPPPIEDDPERSTLLRRQQDEVRRANGKLQPRQRLVLALRELEDRSYAEIGELVGMKENAVAQLIFRARESLRTELRLAQVDPERLPEECRRFLPLLAAHLDGQLKGARRDETLVHLEGCERCQAALADMREASRRYRTLFLPPPGGEDDRAEIDARLTSAGYWEPGRRRVAGRSAQVAAVVVVGLMLGGGGTALGVALSRDAAKVALPTTTTPTAALTQTVAPSETETTTSSPQPTSTVEPTTTTTTQTTDPTISVVLPPEPTTTGTETEVKVKPLPLPPAKPDTTTTTPVTTTSAPPDTTPPTVTIDSGPPASTTVSEATFVFSSSEPGSAFSCSLDGADLNACTSPMTYKRLVAGPHTFSVRATDAAGNVGQPTTHAWTVVRPLPDLHVSAFSQLSITITNRGNGTAGPSVLTITLVGTFDVASIPPGGSVTISWSTCRVGTYTAVVDRTGVVAESDETNNTAVRRNTCS